MVKKLLVLALTLILIGVSPMGVSAEEEDTLPDEYEDFTDGIPSDIADLLPDGIFSDRTDDVIGAVEELTSWEYILNTVLDILGVSIRAVVRALASITALLVICSLLNMFKKSIQNEALDNVLSLISGAVMAASVLEISRAPIERAMESFEQMKIFVNTMSPLICSMYAMGGNISSAIVHNYGLIVFLSILENVCILSLQLIIGVCMALIIASSFMHDNSLIGLNNAIKKTFTFFVGFIMLIFTSVISTQSLLASKADTLSSKTAKLLASQMIPLVGSTLGESLRTAGASIEYLRTNIGIVIIIILVLMILPTLLSVGLYRLVFVLANGIAGLLGCEREGKLVLEISSLYGYVLAIFAICSVILLFLVTVFAKCASPLS
ncbi:MAG: hypothetical protein ACI3XL_00240 [Eubacteriales bacterium]